MRNHRERIRVLCVSFAAIAMVFLLSVPAFSHCDGMDGPVVQAAQNALATGDVKPVLIWVTKNDETEIKRAFEQTVNLRKLGPEARELADNYFFETLVRIHRAAEGAPYTGLKPAGRDLGPAIPAADRALMSGDVEPLTKLLVEQLRTGLSERYKQAMASKGFKAQDIDAGREYVEQYVTFIHYVERMYEAATGPVTGHSPEGEPSHKEE
jgi:hypothetical protein